MPPAKKKEVVEKKSRKVPEASPAVQEVKSVAIPAPVEMTSVEEEAVIVPKSDRYFEAVGRRKTAIARVRIFTKDLALTVNGRKMQEYFPTMELQKIVEDPMKRMRTDGRFGLSVKVKGGGVHAQAEAVRMGIARALTVFNPEFRKRLKKAGFLRRDPRAVERKKFGLKKARRAPQWQKR